MAKKKTTAQRKPIFALVFWDGLRDRAQAMADAEHGGNLTSLVNANVLSAVKDFEQRAKGRKAN